MRLSKVTLLAAQADGLTKKDVEKRKNPSHSNPQSVCGQTSEAYRPSVPRPSGRWTPWAFQLGQLGSELGHATNKIIYAITVLSGRWETRRVLA